MLAIKCLSENQSPLQWVSSCYCLTGKFGFKTLSKSGYTFVRKLAVRQLMKGCFLYDAQCLSGLRREDRLWGGRSGAWANCNFYFSHFEGQGCPSFVCALSLTFDPDCDIREEHTGRPVGEERKSHCCDGQFHCNTMFVTLSLPKFIWN